LENTVTVADWIIVAVIVLSVIQAAISGFFHEAFGIAGLILGYWRRGITSGWRHGMRLI
jgi:hypothetical protein